MVYFNGKWYGNGKCYYRMTFMSYDNKKKY